MLGFGLIGLFAGYLSAPLRKSWSDEIKEDYKSRGN
jgi:hypothetical protein